VRGVGGSGVVVVVGVVKGAVVVEVMMERNRRP
jgi:hypothetical protein